MMAGMRAGLFVTRRIADNGNVTGGRTHHFPYPTATIANNDHRRRCVHRFVAILQKRNIRFGHCSRCSNSRCHSHLFFFFLSILSHNIFCLFPFLNYNNHYMCGFTTSSWFSLTLFGYFHVYNKHLTGYSRICN